MEHMFIVIYRLGSGKWNPDPKGIYETRLYAEMHIKLQKINGSVMQYAIVEGSTVPPESTDEVEARLGNF